MNAGAALNKREHAREMLKRESTDNKQACYGWSGVGQRKVAAVPALHHGRVLSQMKACTVVPLAVREEIDGDSCGS